MGSFLCFALGLRAAASDGLWSLEAGTGKVLVSGVRSFAVPAYKLPQNDRRHLPMGYIRVACDLGAGWRVGAAHARYGTLRASGASGDSDIFDRAEVSLPVVVPLEMAEKVQEWALDVRRHWTLSPRLAFEAGPVLSYFVSHAELGSSSWGGTLGGPVQRFYRQLTTYRENDLRPGAAAAMEFTVTPRWNVRAGYRLALPPARTLQAWSLGAGWRF